MQNMISPPKSLTKYFKSNVNSFNNRVNKDNVQMINT